MSTSSARPCPICGRPAERRSKHYPFCRERCKIIDLGAWASESYVVSRPLTEADEELQPRPSEEGAPDED